MTKDEAIVRLKRFCAYRERCHKEVRTKLLELKVYGDTLEDVMAELVNENYLNEERYARSYVRGKFKTNKWGRNKIIQELKFRQVSPYCIKKGMTEIDEETYDETLLSILESKSRTITEKNLWKKKSKLQKYALSKGYTFDEINRILSQIEL